MIDSIKVITSPDILHDQSEKVLIIQPKDDLKKSLENWVLTRDYAVSIYYYTSDDNDLKWLITVANIVDIVLLDMDNCSEHVIPFFSYLISLPHTYYRCENITSPFELLNKNRFYDFPQFERT